MLKQVTDSLLVRNNLALSDLSNLFDTLTQRNVDYGDLYFQLSQDENWVLEDGIIKEGGFHIDRGVGVRAVSGEKTGFAYSDQINLANLQQCAQAVRGIAQPSQCNFILPVRFNPVDAPLRYQPINPLYSLSQEQKIELLRLVDKTARAEDPRVVQVNAGLSMVYEEMLVAATDGTLAADIRPLIRLSISVLVEQDGKRERGSAGAGGRFGLEWFFEIYQGEQRAVYFAKESVRQALVNLGAVAAPAGLMPVVLGAGWPGVLLHEAVGHAAVDAAGGPPRRPSRASRRDAWTAADAGPPGRRTAPASPLSWTRIRPVRSGWPSCRRSRYRPCRAWRWPPPHRPSAGLRAPGARARPGPVRSHSVSQHRSPRHRTAWRQTSATGFDDVRGSG